MPRRYTTLLGLLLAGLAAIACVTINVYFPEAAVKDLSEKIEDAVEREAAEAGSTSPEPAEAGEPAGARPSGDDGSPEEVSWLRSAADVAADLGAQADRAPALVAGRRDHHALGRRAVRPAEQQLGGPAGGLGSGELLPGAHPQQTLQT